MNIQEFAAMLNSREYRREITKEEKKLAKELGFVVAYGASDDLMELEGAINDEFGCCDGGTAFITKDGILSSCEDECIHFQKAMEAAKKITAHWCKDKEGFTWSYETDFPHETFRIYDDGEKYCRGIVFDINSL
jgi:hypothetical protein